MEQDTKESLMDRCLWASSQEEEPCLCPAGHHRGPGCWVQVSLLIPSHAQRGGLQAWLLSRVNELQQRCPLNCTQLCPYGMGLIELFPCLVCQLPASASILAQPELGSLAVVVGFFLSEICLLPFFKGVVKHNQIFKSLSVFWLRTSRTTPNVPWSCSSCSCCYAMTLTTEACICKSPHSLMRMFRRKRVALWKIWCRTGNIKGARGKEPSETWRKTREENGR